MPARSSRLFGATLFSRAVPVPVGASPRREPRIPCYGLARITFGGQSHFGVLTDVSPSGVYLWTDVRPAVGSVVELAILQPGAEVALAIEATVIRRDEGALALRLSHRAAELPALVKRVASA